MLNKLINTVMGTLVALGLYHYCDVPIEQALAVGFVAIIAYTLSDISRNLHTKE